MYCGLLCLDTFIPYTSLKLFQPNIYSSSVSKCHPQSRYEIWRHNLNFSESFSQKNCQFIHEKSWTYLYPKHGPRFSKVVQNFLWWSLRCLVHGKLIRFDCVLLVKMYWGLLCLDTFISLIRPYNYSSQIFTVHQSQNANPSLNMKFGDIIWIFWKVITKKLSIYTWKIMDMFIYETWPHILKSGAKNLRGVPKVSRSWVTNQI